MSNYRIQSTSISLTSEIKLKSLSARLHSIIPNNPKTLLVFGVLLRYLLLDEGKPVSCYQNLMS